CVTGTDYW
nr:immunoglobulin heavy chain junction region [Mus musculus]